MFMFTGFLACLLNFLGWVITLTSEDNQKAHYTGLGLLAVSMVILAGMVIAEMW